MGSLLPGWDHNVAAERNIEKEEEGIHIPWWLRGQKDAVNLKDTEVRLARASAEFNPLARTSAEPRERRRSVERRRSFDFDSSSEADTVEDAEVDDSGKVKLFWWKRMNTSSLNEKPDSKPQDYRSGSYQPQFKVAGEYNYAAAKNKSSPVDDDKEDLIVL